MRIALQILSLITLVAIIVAAMLFVSGHLSLDQTKSATLLLTIAWFLITPFWMGRGAETLLNHE